MDLERKYKIFEEQSEVIPKALHCYPFCFLSTKTVCIINVWGCAEILPGSFISNTIHKIINNYNVITHNCAPNSEVTVTRGGLQVKGCSQCSPEILE